MNERDQRPGPASTQGDVDSLQRGLEILRSFRSGEKSLRLDDILARTRIPRLSALKLLNTLTAHHFLRHLPELDRYEPDVSCFVLGHSLRASLPIVRVARPIMQAFAEKHGVDVFLALREGMEMMIVEYCSARTEVAEYGAGSLLPLAQTAVGRAWLWAQRPALQAELIERIRSDAGETEMSTTARIYRSFQDLAERGCCFSVGEWLQDWLSIATPLVLAGGQEVLALAAAATEPGSMETYFRETVAPALMDAALRIKSEMPTTE